MSILRDLVDLYGGVPAIVASLNLAAYTYHLMYKKNQLQKEKDIEVNRVKTELDKSLSKIAHVDQSRFDKEFLIYQEVWESLTSLNIRAEKLKYSLKNNKNLAEKDAEILDFFNSILATKEIIHKNSPFYPKSIHAITTDILSQLEDYIANISSIRNDNSEKLLAWASDHNRVYAMSLSRSLENQIKARLDELSGATGRV